MIQKRINFEVRPIVYHVIICRESTDSKIFLKWVNKKGIADSVFCDTMMRGYPGWIVGNITILG